jgi:hypothetical protein
MLREQKSFRIKSLDIHRQLIAQSLPVLDAGNGDRKLPAIPPRSRRDCLPISRLVQE